MVIMNEIRGIEEILKSRPTIEGAGVRLKRVFGHNEVPKLDPFLLLDHFGSDDPRDYLAGFPWHPHRGIETVTYMISGSVEHGDSIGNEGVIRSGDVQWMTAGSGIIHQEMPQRHTGLMMGFQLWVNLPAAQKMIDPKYRDVKKGEIPEVSVGRGVKVKVISGGILGTRGPVQDIVVDPEYYDVAMSPNEEFEHRIKKGYRAFAYVFEGAGSFDPEEGRPINAEKMVIFRDGDGVKIKTDDKTVRFLLVSGKPIGEPVAWQGPIVMNTREELERAFREYGDGTFIKHR